LLKTIVSYPTEEEEMRIMRENINGDIEKKLKTILHKKDILDIQEKIQVISVSDSIYTYIKDIVFSTRKKEFPFAKYLQV